MAKNFFYLFIRQTIVPAGLKLDRAARAAQNWLGLLHTSQTDHGMPRLGYDHLFALEGALNQAGKQRLGFVNIDLHATS